MDFESPPVGSNILIVDIWMKSELGQAEMFSNQALRPLADRLRPESIFEVVGQDHLLGSQGSIGRMVSNGRLASMVLWGPPGCGKTLLAAAAAQQCGLRFISVKVQAYFAL